MTDAEIIKAFKHCEIEFTCFECPKNITGQGCDGVAEEILDLINRQKSEIENQSENFKVLVSDHRTLQQSFDNLKGLYEAEKARVEKAKEKSIYFAKELQTAKAEIEKLQTDNSSMQSTLAKMSMGVEQAKAKAIKEFAEAFKVKFAKERYRDNYVIDDEMLDNLVKEMVGDAE